MTAEASKSAIIWHNPRCSKSRRGLSILEENGVEAIVRLYLEDPPSVSELKEAAQMMGKGPSEFVRRGEKIYKELELGGADDEMLYAAMAGNPILIERPIVFVDDIAILGRPPVDIAELL